jgi:hypothetical protein
MRAQRLRRRIVWLFAAAVIGAAAILGASTAFADDQPGDSKWDVNPPVSTDDGATTQDSKWD